jgi:hypothetical protein
MYHVFHNYHAKCTHLKKYQEPRWPHSIVTLHLLDERPSDSEAPDAEEDMLTNLLAYIIVSNLNLALITDLENDNL